MIGLALAAAALHGGVADATAQTTSQALVAKAQAGAVTVKGNGLLRDGRPWVPRGVVSIAFVSPPAIQKGVYAQAHHQFDSGVPGAIQGWGADTVRFQVSQPGLDPQNPLFTKNFLKAVTNAVLAARNVGLNVIVSLQDETQSGEATPTTLPNDATRRVWRVLAPLFNADTGILFEMLNEPQPPASGQNWTAWQDAMNQTIATIRQTGSHNVVIADGLSYAEQLEGAPLLADPLHAVAYGSHPYAHSASGQTQASWDAKFGRFAIKAPVIVTEWTTIPKYYCDGNTPAAASAFLQYLDDRSIGLAAFAFDFPHDTAGSIMDGPQGTSSSFAAHHCGDAGFGPGQLVQQHFRAHAVSGSAK